jgi:TRAP-type C4-dicarboxylate transport system permease small subunit
VSGIAIVCAALILTYEVMARYLWNAPTIWEIEASVYLLMFSCFMGAAFVLKNNAHIRIELVTSKLSRNSQLLLYIITSILSLLFCVCMAYRAWPMWWEAYSAGWLSESLWGPPLWIPYLFLPVGFTLISAQYIVDICNRVTKYKLQKE